MSPGERKATTWKGSSTAPSERVGVQRNRAAAPAAEEHEAQVTAFLAGNMETIRLFADWARSVTGHRAWGFEDAEDVVQATLLALVKNLRQGRFVGGNLRAYVRRIAKNMCIDNYDRLQRQDAVPLDELQREVTASHSGEDIERNALLDRILDRMEEGCRRLVQLAYVEGYSRAEIGAQLGISEEAARVRLFRCIRAARTMCDSGTSRGLPPRS